MTSKNYDDETLKDTIAQTMRQLDHIIGGSFHSIKIEQGRNETTGQVSFRLSATCRACKQTINVSRVVGEPEAGAELVRLFLMRTASHAQLHSIILARH